MTMLKNKFLLFISGLFIFASIPMVSAQEESVDDVATSDEESVELPAESVAEEPSAVAAEPVASERVAPEPEEIPQSLGFNYIDFSSDRVPASASSVLKVVADRLNTDPNTREVVINGHTDPVGSSEYNMELSLRRATRVREALTSMGVDDSKIRIEGFGATRPIISNQTDEGRAINRRVELNFK